MDEKALIRLLKAMLREDVGKGDVTSSFCPNKPVSAEIRCSGKGWVSGVREVQLMFGSRGVKARAHVKDGQRVGAGKKVISLRGRARDILEVERTALNLMSRMSGVTTATREYVKALGKTNTKCAVAGTRKTTPGMRYFEKKAIVLGGGVPHRMGLYDMILIKDNHLKLFDDVAKAVAAAHRSQKGKRRKLKVEVEVSSVRDALAAAKAGADAVMLDNMSPKQAKAAVQALKAADLRKKVLLEASGGIGVGNIRRYGLTGVDWVSTGRITHSAAAIDFGLEIIGGKIR